MNDQAEQQVATKYNDSAADAVAMLAVLTIIVTAAVYWLAGQ